ncbi:MAG: hypothetical protein ACLPSH_02290 [Vulcanimicrobiaceae bacterium]|jgi:hypothetical protein
MKMSAGYGMPLYRSLKGAAIAGVDRVDDYADGVLLRKKVAKGWEYAVVLHPHLQDTYR